MNYRFKDKLTQKLNIDNELYDDLEFHLTTPLWCDLKRDVLRDLKIECIELNNLLHNDFK